MCNTDDTKCHNTSYNLELSGRKDVFEMLFSVFVLASDSSRWPPLVQISQGWLCHRWGVSRQQLLFQLKGKCTIFSGVFFVFVTSKYTAATANSPSVDCKPLLLVTGDLWPFRDPGQHSGMKEKKTPVLKDYMQYSSTVSRGLFCHFLRHTVAIEMLYKQRQLYMNLHAKQCFNASSQAFMSWDLADILLDVTPTLNNSLITFKVQPSQRGLGCVSNIEYTACSSVWIMGVHLLHNHWYRIDRHTNQGQQALSGSTHYPSVILASGGRQPLPSQGVASSIKSLWHGADCWIIWSPANSKE